MNFPSEQAAAWHFWSHVIPAFFCGGLMLAILLAACPNLGTRGNTMTNKPGWYLLSDGPGHDTIIRYWDGKSDNVAEHGFDKGNGGVRIKNWASIERLYTQAELGEAAVEALNPKPVIPPEPPKQERWTGVLISVDGSSPLWAAKCITVTTTTHYYFLEEKRSFQVIGSIKELPSK